MPTRLPCELEAAIALTLRGSSSEKLEEVCCAVLEKAADPVSRHVGLDADYKDIRKAAVSLRKHACTIVQQYGIQAAIQWLKDDFSIDVGGETENSQKNRISDKSWWRKLIKDRVWKAREKAWLLGAPLAVSWCSPNAQNDLVRDDYATEAFIQKAGLSSGLRGIQARPVRQRRQHAELIARAHGQSDIAHTAGCKDVRRITITVPPNMHPTTSSGTRYRKKNPLWNHTMPDEAQSWLQKHWAKFRAAVKRKGIDWYWILAVHPHQDSTPHWHLVAWAKEKDWKTLSDLLSHYFSATDSSHKNYGVNINPVNGDCFNYIAYVLKNLSSNEKNETKDREKAEEAFNASAWAKTWGIRRFRLSHDKVTVYRHLRKLNSLSNKNELSTITSAAKNGKYGQFLQLVKDCDIHPVYTTSTNRYLDQVRCLTGIRFGKSLTTNTSDTFKKNKISYYKSTVSTEETSKPCELGCINVLSNIILSSFRIRAPPMVKLGKIKLISNKWC